MSRNFIVHLVGLLLLFAVFQVSVESCRIPRIANGKVVSIVDEEVLAPGFDLTDFESVKVECNRYYSLFLLRDSDNVILCDDGDWNKVFLSCEKLCLGSDLTSLSSYASKCELDGLEVPCNQSNSPGTLAHVKCKLGYERPSSFGFTSTLECLSNGLWNHPIPNCVAVCGLQTPLAKTFIVQGVPTLPTTIPWNVAVYRNKELICGGTILTERIIISAAHCYYEEIAGVITLNPLKIFQVVAGKFFRDFDNVEDQVTQTFNVIKISSPGFKGTAGLNEADIASLVLDDFIVYQPHISPICIDLNIEFSSQYELAPHTRGFIGGWGNTGGNQTPSDILRSIEMPVVAHQTCKNEAIAEFEPFIIADKLCAGDKDGSGVCSGDSGAGFVFPKTLGKKKQYFLRGIVSNGKKNDDGCDLNFYVLFTNVLDYLPFIKKTLLDRTLTRIPSKKKVSKKQPKKIVCFYGTWATYRMENGKFDVENINPNLCTHIVYTYFAATSEGNVTIRDRYFDLEKDGSGNIQKFIALKTQNPKLKLLAAIGGWNLKSEIFSNIAATPESRMKFSKNVLDFLQSFSFDGIVLDWEYPSQNGGLPSDKGNFVLLLTKLRNILKPAGLLLVAAVGATENLATISYDIPGVSAQVDFINLMTYDMHAAWEGFTGIHAANKIGPGAITYLDKQLSVEACVKFWLDKGAPPEKLVVAIPTNGQSFTLADASKNGVMATTIRNGNAGEFTKEPGRLGYNEICKNNWTRVFDPDQQSPYAFSGDQWVGYDDKESVAIKCKLIMEKNLGGATIWSLETDDFRGDCGDGVYPILNLVNNALK